ncbi:MAG: cell wall-binding repeat-containing protein [Miniphocaeibacter sp.]|uniref:cell wall-binding repeat-containing protein n=1 Tax=Miniphocaeibacter sp. TaxID=3100973 RepID=UPI0018582235|nr:cell wall-binding repeat-containing protein [Gallicola sp.]
MKKKILSLVLATTLTVSSLIPVTSLADTRELNVTRIAGAGRYETAVEASKATFDKSKYAVVASGEKFADALVGGTLAVQIEAPILLVGKDNLPSVVSSEIKRLEVEKVYLLGGTSTISAGVENSLKLLGVSVERLAGNDRLGTAKKIATTRFKLLGNPITEKEVEESGIAVIDGNHFADALSAAPLVGQFNFDRGDGVRSTTSLLPYKSTMKPYMIFGGTNSIPYIDISSFDFPSFYRFAGKDRYATAVGVADSYKENFNIDIDTIVLVDGTKFPDALASAPVASMNNGAILLTHPTNFSEATKNYINNNPNIENVIIVGGEKSVSKNIEKELRGELAPTPAPVENNFDKLDKGLQAFLMTSISDERVFESRNLDYMEFYYEIKDNNIYTFLTSGVGSGHPANKFIVNKDSITYKNSVVFGIDEIKVYNGQDKTVTKNDLYDEYLKYKKDYDTATNKIKSLKELNTDFVKMIEDSIR